MPVSASQVDRLSDRVAALYGEAERVMLHRIAQNLAKGIDGPNWAQEKLLEFQLLQARLRGELNTLAGKSATEIAAAIMNAYNAGQAGALADLAVAGLAQQVAAGANPAGLLSIRALIGETATEVIGSHARILRSVEDAYRAVIAEASPLQLAGALTRREAAQRALNAFADRGITAFTDRAGRQWSMTSYTEMATRTAARRAQWSGHADQLLAHGQDLVIVSDHSQECSLCRPWEGKVLSLSGAPHVDADWVATLGEAQAAGLGHPGCVAGGTLVAAPSGVCASDSRWYEGQVVVIHTAGGQQLTITPNHPVLTPEGWVAAGAIKEGAHVVSHQPDVQRMGVVSPNEELIEACIGDVHGALRESFPMATVRVPASPEQFHGDGSAEGDVEVVATHRLLEHVRHSDSIGNGALFVGGVRLADFLRGRTLHDFRLRQNPAGSSDVRSLDLRGSLLRAHGGPLSPLSLASISAVATVEQDATHAGLAHRERIGNLGLSGSIEVHSDGSRDPGFLDAGDRGASLLGRPDYPSGAQSLVDDGGTYAKTLGDVDDSLPSDVALTEVIKVERRDFTGHVFNLQSADGWYFASSIVVHNCRHTFGLFIPGVTEPPTHTADPQGDADRQQLRYLERGVRQWRAREAAALDPAEAARCRAKVREWQGRIREHVAETGVKRQPFRESMTAAR